MFIALGSFINRTRWGIIVLGAAAVAVSAFAGLSVFSRLDSGGFASTKFESYRALQEVNNNFGNSGQVMLVLFEPRNGLKVSDPAYQAAVERTLAATRRDPRVTSVTDYYAARAPQLISRDGRDTFAVVQIGGSMQQAITTAKDLRPRLTSPTLAVSTGGVLAINQDFNAQIAHDLKTAETISFILLAVLLIVVFRGLVAAFLPLALGGFGVLGAFGVVRLLTNVMTISQYAINVIILLGLGLSIDYSLFMVSRFREELRGSDPRAALITTMRTAGRTVFFSGLTVILSLLGLLVFPLSFLQSIGVGASAAVAVAMLGALTLLPALLAAFGRRVNALSFGRIRREYRAEVAGTPVIAHPLEYTFWYRLARAAMRWPVITVGLIVIPLAFMGQFFLRAQFSSADYRSLPATTPSRHVADVLTNDFPGGNTNPVQLVIHTPASAFEPANLQELKTYTTALGNLPGVTSVDSILTLEPALPTGLYASAYDSASTPPTLAHAAAGFATGRYYLVNLSYNSAYDEPLARALVSDARAQVHPAGWNVLVGGSTADLVDLLNSIAHYAPIAGLVVAGALFVLLLIMFRSIIIPLQALFVNVLTLSATFGALVWIFQEGHLEHLLGFTSLGSIDATQPVLIFGIAFGLSMDYSVFLLSRIKEQYDHLGNLREGIAQGLAKTGPIITSAAVLFIVVVGAFATSSIPIIKQIGIGLGLAVFLDAFIVRLLLVPAVMIVCGRANWWPSRPKAVKVNQ